MMRVFRLWYFAAAITLFVAVITSAVPASAAPSTLANVELEQRLDDAFRDGAELAKAASCMDDPAMIELAFKAYRDTNKALRAKDGATLNAAFARGMKKSFGYDLGFKNCMIAAMLEGRKTMLRGATAATALLDKSLLPATMGSVSGDMMGVMVYAQFTFVDPVAECVEDASFRKELSEDYVGIMRQFLADRGNKVTPEWMAYPFERSDGRFKTEIGGRSRHPSCARRVFAAGMAAELFRQVNEAGNDTRGRWLVKRLSGR